MAGRRWQAGYGARGFQIARQAGRSNDLFCQQPRLVLLRVWQRWWLKRRIFACISARFHPNLPGPRGSRTARPLNDKVQTALTDTIFTWPNLITVVRIFVVLPVIWLVHAGAGEGQSDYLWLALVLMLACEISDWLDGYLARRMNWVSSSGKVLDPMADSLYRISVFVALVANGWMPVWMLLIMAARDLGMSEVRLLAQRARITLAARSSGKLKAAVQGLAQFAIVLFYAIGGGQVSSDISIVINALLYLATFVTLWSIVDYALGVSEALRQKVVLRH